MSIFKKKVTCCDVLYVNYSEKKLSQHFAVKNSVVIVQCNILMKR